MKIGVIPQNPAEWVAIKANLLPLPLVHSQLSFILSKAVLDSFELNVFESMKDGNKTLDEISISTSLDKRGLKSLLNILLAAGYLKYSSGEYGLTKMAKKWCLKNSPFSLYDQQLFNQVCWKWMDYLQTFLKTGKGLQYHDTFNEQEWTLYQKGMENVALGSAKAAVKSSPKLKNPMDMLDIGGSHGMYSVEYCKKYPDLKVTILDLPSAVEKAIPILKKHYKEKNIHYRKGNVLEDDLEQNKFDLILMSSLMHHFNKEQNEEVSKKIQKALKPGGYFIIQEFLRPEPSRKMEMIGTILDLFFNLSSTSGNWSKEELVNFQTSAGLKYIKTNKFIAPPGFVQIIGQKV
jgi:2-polyprenyl-3-methyl-5-hydroxy-6-metoxy-1,4-benzoquinol methylase